MEKNLRNLNCSYGKVSHTLKEEFPTLNMQVKFKLEWLFSDVLANIKDLIAGVWKKWCIGWKTITRSSLPLVKWQTRPRDCLTTCGRTYVCKFWAIEKRRKGTEQSWLVIFICPGVCRQICMCPYMCIPVTTLSRVYIGHSPRRLVHIGAALDNDRNIPLLRGLGDEKNK